MDKVVIWGATGQAIVLEELLSADHVEISALFDNNEKVVSPIKGVPLYYGESGYKQWIQNTEDTIAHGFIIAVGGGSGAVRQQIATMLKKDGLLPYTAIHKKAFVAANALIGEGCQIMANANICARVQMGNYCIINTAANVDHECVIGDNVHIAPGAVLTGCITVGNNTFVGANSTILPRLTIGNNVIIGAGAVITKNVADGVTIIGNPGKSYSKQV